MTTRAGGAMHPPPPNRHLPGAWPWTQIRAHPGLGPPGSEIGTPGFERPDQGDGARLWNIAPLIPAEHRFSRVLRGHRELLDHILVSSTLVQRVEQVDTGPGEPPSITEDPRGRRDELASDHLPVVARFRLE